MRAGPLLLSIALCLWGCGAPSEIDGSTPDGSARDGGENRRDAASERDGSAMLDGGTSDGGGRVDAGSMDGGGLDGGGTDGGGADGGAIDDGGTPPPPLGALLFDVAFLHPGLPPDARLTGDIDGDGARDAIVIERSAGDLNVQDVTFYVRRGDAFVESYRTTAAGWNAEIGAVGDLDGDARPDAAMLVRSGERDWVFLHGRGDGTFERPESVSVNGDDAAFADWNEDGRLDYAVRQSSAGYDHILVYLSAAGGGRTSIDLGATPARGPLLAGDFDGDGRLDLLGFPSRLFLGTSTGFAAGRTLTECATCESPAVGDLDGDGNDDVAAILPGSTSDAIVVLRAGADGTPSEAARYPMYQARSLTVGDVDADGRLDLVATYSPLNLSGGDGLEILYGAAGLDHSADRRRYFNPTAWTDVTLVEATGDARPDVMVDGRWVFAGGEGRDLHAPTASAWQASESGWLGPMLERFDGDARPDLLWLEGTLGDARVLPIQADRYLAPMTTCANTGPEPRHRMFDLDADGDLDAIHFGASEVVTWIGSGGCVFGAAQRSAVVPNRYGTLVEDLNGDGLRDLAWRTATSLEVAGATSAGVFGASTSTSTSAAWGFLSTGDLDGDAYVDVISVGSDGDEVTVFYGEGGLAFRAGPRIDVPGLLEGSALGDADDDGDPDLLVVALSTRSELVLLRNDGSGALGPPEPLSSLGPAASVVAVTDIDEDGATEIVLVGGDWLRIFRLTGAVQLLDTPLDRGVRTIDADADGDLDLVHHDSNSGRHVFVVAQNRAR